jgi:Ran GTPase-activating protein (RanGAP) involved in mRNA processing and transport
MELNLLNNQIGAAGAQAIAEALKFNTSLTKLCLDRNQIGAVGAQAIAEALKVNASLTELELDSNHIGDAGAQAIAEALKFNTSLTELYLLNNQIGADGAQAIADGLTTNLWITELPMDKMSGKLLQRIERNRALLKSRARRQRSLFGVMEDPSRLLNEGRDVYREVGRSILRALVSLDFVDLLPKE